MEQQQHDARLAAEAEARRRALEAEENARRQQVQFLQVFFTLVCLRLQTVMFFSLSRANA